MSKMISGSDFSLERIFCSDYDFIIPSYQRPYAWEEVQAEELFDDLYSFYNSSDSNEGYFLGSIVLIKEEGKPEAQIVDGQQRITTLTILFSAIASRMTGDCRDECWNLIREKGSVVHNLAAKPRLKLRERNVDFFRKYVQELKICELLELKNSQLKNDVEHHIRDNARVFVDRLDTKFGGNQEQLLAFLQFLVSRCFIVVVSTPNTLSAFRIFSVLNNRGLDLLPTDIIKAEMIGKIPDTDRDQYTEKWEDIEEETGRDAFCVLFGHIRTICAKAKAKRMLTEEFDDYVVPKIGKPENFIDNILSPYAEAYRVLTKQTFQASGDVSYATKINDLLGWLGRVNNSDWIPPAILFLSTQPDDETALSFFTKLERLSAYMHVCGKNVNNRIERFAKITRQIEDGVKLSDLELSMEEKDDFVKKLDGDIYNLTAIRRNYVILRLDSFESDKAASYAPATLTIEHVLPQTPDKGGQWMSWWPDENERKFWTHRVANLVPLTRAKNSAAQNYEFDVKKSKYFKSERGISSYGLTSWVLCTEKWTPEVLRDRQAHLLETFKKKWSL